MKTFSLDDDNSSLRKDLTKKYFITIDGVNSKDLDDSFIVEKNNDNYILEVAIADVSNYVKLNSSTDKEALDRGTSIYFGNSVIPMLPKILSNNLCSLNPNEPKLTLNVRMYINKHGEIKKI